jgi:ribosomal protein S12 methylthiotransferase accessory factor YcaO
VGLGAVLPVGVAVGRALAEMTLSALTYAQQDALYRLNKRFAREGKIETGRRDDLGRLHVVLPGEEPLPRRRRAITTSGLVERVS